MQRQYLVSTSCCAVQGIWMCSSGPKMGHLQLVVFKLTSKENSIAKNQVGFVNLFVNLPQ